MAEPFIGEIRLFGFGFPPQGWALCNGQLLPIGPNQALFALLGTTYGGDGQTWFALPDLRDRLPIHRDAGHVLGQVGGEAAHTLLPNEIPPHTHSWTASASPASSGVPSGMFAATAAEDLIFRDGFEGATQLLYGPAQGLASLRGDAVGMAGQSQAHDNMQPHLTVSFCIALQGIFPSPP